MALVIFLCVGAGAAAAVLVFSLAALAFYVARGLAWRRAGEAEKADELRRAFRHGLLAGAVVAWAVLALSFSYFRPSRYVVIDNWWSVTWIFNATVGCAAALVLLLWFVRAFYLRAKERVDRAAYRRRVVIASCAYACLWLSALVAYRWFWRPWFRSCAMRTIQEQPFNPHIAPALQTFVKEATPEEERELTVCMHRNSNPAARFNAAYILARRRKPGAVLAALDALEEMPPRSASARDDRFSLAYARTALMQVTGFRASDDFTPPTESEWAAWKQWEQAQGAYAAHVEPTGRR